MLKLTHINIEFGARTLLNIDELSIYDYDRIGFIGANGAGKSTLLNMIAQHGDFQLMNQLTAESLADSQNFSLTGKLGVLNLETPKPSGGELTRIKIANAFSTTASGLLADEPTSHLDQEGIDFLIAQFKKWNGPYLIVSHDRDFLDQTVDKIWELKNGSITEYWGGYSDYEAQKQAEEQTQLETYQQAMAEKKRLETAALEKVKQARQIEKKAKSGKKNTESGGRLSHQKSMGSKQKKLHQAAKSLQNRAKELDDIETPNRLRTIRFHQNKALELHNPYPIMGENICKQVGDKVLFQNADFSFPLGEKIAITGPNGSGKSTLMSMILAKEPGISLSPKAKIGYFAQNSYQFQTDSELLAYMNEDSDYHLSNIRAVLAAMGFGPGDLTKKIQQLSGGERVKLYLAKLLTGRYNILILDEPGNYLDIQALSALETLIKNYQGTVLLITHDRKFREVVATMTFEIRDKKLVLIGTF